MRHEKRLIGNSQDHIALRHFRQVVDSHIRLSPMDSAVHAFGIQRNLTLMVFSPTIAPVRAGDFVAAIVQPQPVAILQHCRIVTKRARRHPPTYRRTRPALAEQRPAPERYQRPSSRREWSGRGSATITAADWIFPLRASPPARASARDRFPTTR